MTANAAIHTSLESIAEQAPRSLVETPPETRNEVAGAEHAFPPKLLRAGFTGALMLAAACFGFSAVYLYKYLVITSDAVDSIIKEVVIAPASLQMALSARLAVAKYSLLSCGVVTGLAFGFLGFALFLLGVQGNMDVKANQAGNSIQLARIAPGTFVILCAAVLAAISVTHRIDFDVSSRYEVPVQGQVSPPAIYPAPEVGHDKIP